MISDIRKAKPSNISIMKVDFTSPDDISQSDRNSTSPADVFIPPVLAQFSTSNEDYLFQLQKARDPKKSFQDRTQNYAYLSFQLLNQRDFSQLRKVSEEWGVLLRKAPSRESESGTHAQLREIVLFIAEGKTKQAMEKLEQFPDSNLSRQLRKELYQGEVVKKGKVLLGLLKLMNDAGRNEDNSALTSALLSWEREMGQGFPLDKAFDKLEMAERILLEKYFSSNLLKGFGSIQYQLEEDQFFSELCDLGTRLKLEGQVSKAFLLLKLLESKGQGTESLVPEGIRQRASKELQGITDEGGIESLGMRTEFYLASLSWDQAAFQVNHAGALLGLATLGCSLVPGLRPMAAGGIRLLSAPTVASLLLWTGAYSLYRQAPSAWSAFQRLGGWEISSTKNNWFEDLLTVSGFSIGALGIGLGASSFYLGGKTAWLSRSQALAEGATGSQAWRLAYVEGDAVRRAVQDPSVWLRYAESATGLSLGRQLFLKHGSEFLNRALIGGSALVGAGRLVWGAGQLMNRSSQGHSVGLDDMGGLLLGFATDVFPAVTLKLYRAGRGDRNFSLGPALSQELTEAHYNDPFLRRRAVSRIDEGLAPLSDQMKDNFIQQALTDLPEVARALQRAEVLEGLASVASDRSSGVFLKRSSKSSLNTPVSPAPVKFKASSTGIFADGITLSKVAELDLAGLRKVYEGGDLSPVGLFRLMVEHPAARNGAVFPRSLLSGPLHEKLLALAEGSQRRFELGQARPLEGVFVAVKDLFVGMDGKLNHGSKTGSVAGVGASPLVNSLLDLGAIPVPVNLVAAASGGTGQHAGFGYISNPNRPGFDPAGSSSGTAYVVGLKDFPINLGVGTDTGGSVTAPAGAVGLFGIVPPQGILSTKNILPFATFLDRVGILANHPQDAMTLARYLARREAEDPHAILKNPGELFKSSSEMPKIAYLSSLLEEVSPKARKNFLAKMMEYQKNGYEVLALGSEWNFLADAPLKLYPFDAYPAGVFTHTNPLQGNRFDPPRRTLDDNLKLRLPKGALAIELGYFDQARALSQKFLALTREKLGEGIVLASPATEAIPSSEILAGKAGAKLDLHDKITMAKNRVPEWGQMVFPEKPGSEVGVAFSGHLPDLMHFIEQTKLEKAPKVMSETQVFGKVFEFPTLLPGRRVNRIPPRRRVDPPSISLD